ncbi:DinB family protein [Cellulomonas dongxiuzhuiae]|uniref:DinB family protein n=1 Tax=Cellulomonas dongxiuzhuiae TaxID=2819979 RepID=A0ABX8GK44_9CELL|nr:DinB family protein [Cellulomonas dongxiuzhuiae]MBO3095000.1 DinB family protein [Cellulomonas dongxiuzhuiae]QWC16016.1 DinB family protein [Cellulomonas dongxiuzhuiae]
MDTDAKATLHRYLRRQREGLVGKLDGLDEYDARRPLTGTGTNLLGLVKHVASVQVGYLGEVFGRPAPRDLPWYADGAEPDADMGVPADESRASVLDLWQESSEHADRTLEALPLDAVGEVPWWSEPRVTLHEVLVHVLAEVARHAGHADVLREQLDGSTGLVAGDPNVPSRSPDEWAAYRARIEQAARDVAGR